MSLAPDSNAAALFADEADSQIDEWTLDDLERSAELGSLRPSWTSADDDR